MGELREIWPGMTVFASGNVRMVVQSIDGDSVVVEVGLSRIRLEMSVAELRAATEASTYRTEIGEDGTVRTRIARFAVPVIALDGEGKPIVDAEGVAVQAKDPASGEPLFENMVAYRPSGSNVAETVTRADYDEWRGTGGRPADVQIGATNDTSAEARALRDEIVRTIN